MNQKIGRNDTCPCGSGKKYKNCCLDKNFTEKLVSGAKRKLTAKWINQPSSEKIDTPDLMEQTFGEVMAKNQPFQKVSTVNEIKESN